MRKRESLGGGGAVQATDIGARRFQAVKIEAYEISLVIHPGSQLHYPLMYERDKRAQPQDAAVLQGGYIRAVALPHSWRDRVPSSFSSSTKALLGIVLFLQLLSSGFSFGRLHRTQMSI